MLSASRRRRWLSGFVGCAGVELAGGEFSGIERSAIGMKPRCFEGDAEGRNEMETDPAIQLRVSLLDRFLQEIRD